MKYAEELESLGVDAGNLIAERENKAMIAALVEELGESCRKILLLFYFENLSMKDIVAITRYANEQVARNKKYLCLKQLAQKIDERPELRQTLKAMLNGPIHE